MYIKELSNQEFDKYSLQHELSSYHQTTNYALLMAEHGYDYDLVGLVDEEENIHAASLILLKKITFNSYYGYAPKGFLLNYFDYDLLKEFTEKITEYYNKKNVVFIKINPEIAIGLVDNTTFETKYNQNGLVKEELEHLNYVKLKNNIYFESLLPRFNGIVNLKKYDTKLISKVTRNKINKAKERCLSARLGNRNDIKTLFTFVKDKKNRDELYYLDYYNIFNKSNDMDLFIIELKTRDYLINMQDKYQMELNINNNLQELVARDPNLTNVNKKMNSDQKLLSYKNDIAEASKYLSKTSTIPLAGALVVRHKNRVNIVISGFDRKYKKYNANYFLHDYILNYYKDNYLYADLNGLTGDFTLDNPYNGLNKFKLGFKPNIYEFIGEFDLIIKQNKYATLLNNGILSKEFNKPTNLKNSSKD